LLGVLCLQNNSGGKFRELTPAEFESGVIDEKALTLQIHQALFPLLSQRRPPKKEKLQDLNLLI
jgi:hypothetical protein